MQNIRLTERRQKRRPWQVFPSLLKKESHLSCLIRKAAYCHALWYVVIGEYKEVYDFR